MEAAFESPEKKGCKKTRFALFWMRLADEPFVALYALLLFILRKDLNASAFQISLFVTLKPVLALFSFYWSANLKQRKKHLSNLMWAWVLARAPFLLIPFLSNIWYLIFAAGFYQLFYRAGHPALMEILKIKIPKKPREKLFSTVYILTFIENIFIGLFLSATLDKSPFLWKIYLFLSALIGLTSLFFQKKIDVSPPLMELIKPSFKERIIKPWKEAYFLIKTYKDFAHFQWGFMLGGAGLMLFTPALAVFYADVLALTHKEIALARCLFMSFGVVLASPLWAKFLNRVPLSDLMGWIICGFVFFPLFLMMAQWHLFYLYLAFFIYGIAQAGSHLLWNLSGTLFAKDQDSTPFSVVNVLTVGIRGLIFPILGGILCEKLGPLFVMILGICIGLAGVTYSFVRKWVKA